MCLLAWIKVDIDIGCSQKLQKIAKRVQYAFWLKMAVHNFAVTNVRFQITIDLIKRHFRWTSWRKNADIAIDGRQCGVKKASATQCRNVVFPYDDWVMDHPQGGKLVECRITEVIQQNTSEDWEHWNFRRQSLSTTTYYLWWLRIISDGVSLRSSRNFAVTRQHWLRPTDLCLSPCPDIQVASAAEKHLKHIRWSDTNAFSGACWIWYTWRLLMSKGQQRYDKLRLRPQSQVELLISFPPYQLPKLVLS